MTPDHLPAMRRACGLVGPLRLVVSPLGQSPTQEWEADGPFALIGRDPGNHLWLDDELVSRRHAYLQVIAGQPYLLDLGSRTGIRGTGWLAPGQMVGIGPFSVQVQMQGASAEPVDWPDPLVTRVINPESVPPVTLEVTRASGRSATCRLTRVLVLVGRVPQCKLQLVHESVSKIHCALVGTPEGVWMVDLLSREGVWVNEERRRWSRLADGDRLRVGKYTIRICYDGSPSPQQSRRTMKPAPVSSVYLREDLDEEASRGREPPVPESPPEHALVPIERPRAPLIDPGAVRDLVESSLLLPMARQFQALQQQMFDQFHQSMMMMAQMFSRLHSDQMGLVREELDHLHRLTQELQGLQAELRSEPGTPRETIPPPRPASPEVPAVAVNSAPPPPAPIPRPAAAANGPGPELHDTLSQRIAELQEERQSRWQRLMGVLFGK